MAITQIELADHTIGNINDYRLPASLGSAGQALVMNQDADAIQWGSAGTEVIANPTVPSGATALTGISIGGVVYKIEGGVPTGTLTVTSLEGATVSVGADSYTYQTGETTHIFGPYNYGTYSVRATKAGMYEKSISATVVSATNTCTCVPSRLPDGYTELTYIQSSGTQYINTGIYSKDITSAEVKFNLSNNNNYTGFGDTTVGTGSGYPASMWCENSAIKWYYSGGSAITLGSRNTDITATLPFPTQTAGSTVHIFHANGAVTDKCASGNFYYTRLLNGTDVVFNGIPAKRDSDNAIGMYDTISNTLFTNAGTGVFVPGDPVT